MSQTTVPIHVKIPEDLLDRIETLVDESMLSKSEIVRRTLEYGIPQMEEAVNRLTDGKFIPRNYGREV